MPLRPLFRKIAKAVRADGPALRTFQGGLVLALIGLSIALVFAVASSRVSGTPYPTANLRIVEVSPDFQDWESAYSALSNIESLKKGYSASRQPEGPFWLLIPLDVANTDRDLAIELRLLRSSSLEFWANRIDKSGKISISQVDARNEKGGTTIKLRIRGGESVEVIGKISPLGVARPKVFVWSESQYLYSEKLFERGGGALLGAFLMLAIFSAFVGIINRDWSFFLFAGWLITSLRVAAINDGWDLAWLGIKMENETFLVFLRLSLAAHALLTVSLFRVLLEKELRILRADAPLRIATVVAAAILLIGIELPHRQFLPLVWTATGVTILAILLILGAVVYKTRTSVSTWYAASWGTTFLGILTEVGYASGLVGSSIPGLNSQTASIASALMTSIALSEKLRMERTARVAAQKEAVTALQVFRDNYNSMPVGLFSLSQTGSLLLFNPAFLQMFPRADRIATDETFIDTVISKGVFGQLLEAARSPAGGETEVGVETEDGIKRWFLARVRRKDDSIEGSIQDITSRKAAEVQLKHLVDHDHLTGLRNRRGLESTIAQALTEVSADTPCALAYVDIDRFKLINDLHGHGVGDVLLQQTGQRLLTAVRQRDVVARVGDSFVVVFFDCPDYAVAGLTERLRSVIGDFPYEAEGKGIGVTASVGVVMIDSTMSAVDAMAAADRACGEAKAKGRNCVVRLTEKDDVLRIHREELKVVADMQRRIPTDRYFLEFQPIVALHSAMASMNYEVLIRMRGDNGQTIPPGKFIGAAERNGLMSHIDRWVLRTTLEWLDDHPAHRDQMAFATINISGSSLNDTRFVDDAFAMISEHPHAMPKLCFEITESVALHDLGSTRRFVDRVRTYGSKLALDDFGAGYTSFNYLKEIPADFIKIDGSFVKDINKNPANYSITRTIVELTHELGMRSIAEWAESVDVIASLCDLAVDYGQGFALARPMSPDIVLAAGSSGALVRDEAVVSLLNERSRKPVSGTRRKMASLRK